LQEQKPDEALDELRRAVEHPDTRTLALTLAGKTLLRQRHFETGERMLHLALMEDPNLLEAHRVLGAAYVDVGDVGAALVHLVKAAELSPDDPRPHRLMADIHRAFHQDESALEDLSESVRRAKIHPEIVPATVRRRTVLELAQLQNELLRHEEALETLKTAEETPDTLGLRAVCHHALGDLESAATCAARALQLDPDHVVALMMRGRLAMGANDVTLAQECLERIVELSPMDPTAHYMLSQTHHRLGQDDLAEEHATKAAEIRDLSQEYTEAYERTAREPRQPQSCFRLGLMAERLGLPEAAAGWYRATLLLDPQHAEAIERASKLPGGLTGMDGSP
jgi:tetratricopeptide (TPR) repeat protein